MKFKKLLIAACLMSIGTCTTAFANTSGTLQVNVDRPMVDLVANVVYEQVPSRGFANVPMRMDIIKQHDKELHPCIVYVTGGGFINANKDSYIQQRMDLAEHGYVVASIEYRVAPTATFPQPLEDVKAAVRYLRANSAKFGVDPNRIGLLGCSAGGYLVTIAGTTNGTRTFDVGDNLNYSSDVQAVCDTYGITDLTKIGMDYSAENQAKHKSPGATEALWVNGSPVFGGIDGGIGSDPQKLEAAQPMNYISDKTPPFLIMHGTADVIVSPGQSDLLYEALTKKGIEAELYKVTGAAHGGDYWVQKPIMDKIIAFFDKNLKK